MQALSCRTPSVTHPSARIWAISCRTWAGGGPDEPPKLVRILRQPPLSVLSGGGAPVPSEDINCSPSSWTRSEPPRLVMRGGESPRIVSPTHPLSLIPSHHTSLRTHTPAPPSSQRSVRVNGLTIKEKVNKGCAKREPLISIIVEYHRFPTHAISVRCGDRRENGDILCGRVTLLSYLID